MSAKTIGMSLAVAVVLVLALGSGAYVTPPDPRCMSWRATAGNPGEGAGATEFISAVDAGGQTPNASEAAIDVVLTPVALEFADMYVLLDVAPDNGGGTQAKAITLMDDTSATAVTCTISEATTNCQYSGATVVVAAGSKVDFKLVNTGTPAAAAEIIISLCSSP